MAAQPAENENSSPTASLYTELPYPADGVVRTALARIIRAEIQRSAPHLLGRTPLRIVDVGCGTGEHTAGLARIFPHAKVIGVDINTASLEFARHMAARTNLSVEFVRCDITNNLAAELNAISSGPFDIVSSVGVLHHLADPRVGFAAIRQIVSPDGWLFCYLYTHYGRREDLAIKSLLSETLPADASLGKRAKAIVDLRLENVHTLWNGIKRIRNRIRFGPPLLPLEMARVLLQRNRLVHVSDTYSNPCEHLYRFSEIQSLLAETQWDIVGLAKKAGLPTTPEEHTRRAAQLVLLRQMSPAALYDYFAFYYRANGFCFFARPTSNCN